MVRLGCEAFTRFSIQVLDAHARNDIERAWREDYRTVNRVSKPASSWKANKAQSVYLFRKKFKGQFSVALCQERRSRAETGLGWTEP